MHMVAYGAPIAMVCPFEDRLRAKVLVRFGIWRLCLWDGLDEWSEIEVTSRVVLESCRV